MTNSNSFDRIYNCHMNKEVFKMFYSEQQVVDACTGEPSQIFNVIKTGEFEIIEKLLRSAIANAENNHFMNRSNLYVAEIYANQGPTLKRIRPAAKGSAVRIRKRTSHITIVLKEKEA